VTGNSYKTVTVRAVEESSVKAAALDISYATVNDAVTLSGNLASSYSTFSGKVTAASVEDERSEFSKAITAKTGDITLTGSTISSSAAVTSEKGNIEMTKVTGTAGALNAYSVTINNAEANAELKTGNITADGAVTLTANYSCPVSVGKDDLGVSVRAASMDVTYAEIDGSVGLSGKLKSAYSDFDGEITLATTVEDERSMFHDSITTTTGNVTLTGSEFTDEEADVISSGNIEMTKVTGTVGDLYAYSVTINNAQAVDTLTTGDIKAVGAISVTGNSAKQVTVDGTIEGTTLTASYAKLSYSIDTSTSVTANNCTVGLNSVYSSNIASPTVSISNSKIMLGSIDADTVTISSPALYSTEPSNPSGVTTIRAKNLTVTADDSNLIVNDVIASSKIAINGGTYGNSFEFTGSTASTITSGTFAGTFSHGGSATLTITGGFFTGSQQRLAAGKTIINGTYSPLTSYWNLKFYNLSVADDAACEIKSGYFKAATVDQMSRVGNYIAQTSESVSATKFVELVYTSNTIGSSSPSYLSLNGTNVKKAVVNFESPLLATGRLEITYPESVELRGEIELDEYSGQIYSHGREMNNKNGYSIVYKYNTSTRIYPYGTSPYIYAYPTP
jgi:hypothetical protein